VPSEPSHSRKSNKEKREREKEEKEKEKEKIYREKIRIRENLRGGARRPVRARKKVNKFMNIF
jgi:hypothetical protein